MLCDRILALSLLASGVDAQTFVVDQANGPGTNFTALTAAVAAVPGGSTLLVRAGSYSPPVLDSIGLTVLADANVFLTGTIAVRNTAANQAVTLRRLRNPNGDYELTACAGPVLVDGGIDIVSNMTEVTGVSLLATGCEQLTVRDARFANGNSTLSGCHAVIEGCAFQGRPGTSGAPGLWIGVGSTQVVGSHVRGGDAVPPTTTNSCGPGILLGGGVLRLPYDPDTVIERGAANAWLWLPQAMAGAGDWHLDALYAGTSTIAGSGIGNLLLYPMPVVRAAGAPPGGTAIASVRGPTGALALLAFGLPGPRSFVPGVVFPFWLDPASAAVDLIGVLGPQQTTAITTQKAVPNAAALRGARFSWQALTLDAALRLQVANPATFVIE